MKNKFVGLIILDGYGLRKQKSGNAIAIAKPKNIINYFKKYPYTTLEASGESVGLPKGQMGNSEVGHLNIGAGRVVMQSLQQINTAIENGKFKNNVAIKKTFAHVKKNDSTLHLMGLASTGGVHSHIKHLYELIKNAKAYGIKKVLVHVFTDGRDVNRESAVLEVEKLQEFLKNYENYEIATIMGRFYAMDREKNYDRTQKAYNAIVKGISQHLTIQPIDYIKSCYEKQLFDEFIEPAVVVSKNNKPIGTLKSNDGIVFYNFRQDRARQLTESLVENGFKEFSTKQLKNISITTMTCYDKTFKKPLVAFEKDIVKDNLSKVVSKAGLSQFKITETTKYAHVTYFLNGSIEEPYEKEDRVLIETIKTEHFEFVPQMRAVEITDKAIELVKNEKHNLMVLNYSNCDMIGHTGNLNAAVETVKILNTQVKRLVDEILKIDGIAILTADHGNAEEMIGKNGEVLTDHTTNKVPFCVVGKGLSDIKLAKSGILGNIAPTILDLLGVKKPKSFECDSLIVKKKRNN